MFGYLAPLNLAHLAIWQNYRTFAVATRVVVHIRALRLPFRLPANHDDFFWLPIAALHLPSSRLRALMLDQGAGLLLSDQLFSDALLGRA